MDLFECFDGQLHHNSLDAILGVGSFGTASSEAEPHALHADEGDRNCVTYQWMMDEQEPPSHSCPPDDPEVQEMKAARTAQEERLHAFLLADPSALDRKTSAATACPKKKRIRRPRRSRRLN